MKDFAIGALAWIFLISYFLAVYGYSLNGEKYERFLGKELILCGDTVMITDFSWRKSIYYLNNGARIEKKLAVEIYNSQNNN